MLLAAMFSIPVFLLALYVIAFPEGYSEIHVRGAFGFVGLILGYWLR